MPFVPRRIRCLWGAIALVTAAGTRRWWRWLVVAAAVLVTALVALAARDRAADVAGGLTLAAAWLGVTAWLLMRHGP